MNLRKLDLRDAPFMLEWMHDESVVKDLQADFKNKTIDDCVHFIETARDMSKNCHLAIVDDSDEYMGTVSLKHLNLSSAEFGIAIRKKAMGKGYSKSAMTEIIQYGFNVLHLQNIYWCVNPMNTRALRFYDKNNYTRVIPEEMGLTDTIRKIGTYTEEQVKNYIWYNVSLT